MSRVDNWFSKLWAKRKEPPTSQPAKPKKREVTSAADVQRNAVIEAAERRRRQWNKYIEARKSRLDKLAETYPNVSKYRATLRSLIKDPETEWTGPRDCNVDLADLVQSLALDRIPRDYDRFLLLEITRDAIAAIGKRAGIEPQRLIDDVDPLPPEGTHTASEVDRVAHVLRLR